MGGSGGIGGRGRGERSGGLGGGVGLWGQGGCERRTEVFVKIQKTIFFFLGGGGGGVGLGGGGGVRVDVNQELKFFGKFKKKMEGGEGGPWGGPGGQDGCNEELKFL